MAGQVEVRDGVVAIRKAGTVVHVGGCESALGQSNGSAYVQSVSLVVIEDEEARRWREVGEAAADRSYRLGDLVGVSKVNVSAVPKLWGAQGQLPTLNAGAINRKREENVGFANAAVIKEISDLGVEVVSIDDPATERNGNAELALFIALAMEGEEAKIVVVHELEQRSRGSYQRRRLIELAVKPAKDPVEAWDSDRRASARTGGVLDHAGIDGASSGSESCSPGVVSLAHATAQHEPGSELDLIL